MNDPHLPRIPSNRRDYLWHHPTKGWTTPPRPRRQWAPSPVLTTIIVGALLYWGITAAFNFFAR